MSDYEIWTKIQPEGEMSGIVKSAHFLKGIICGYQDVMAQQWEEVQPRRKLSENLRWPELYDLWGADLGIYCRAKSHKPQEWDGKIEDQSKCFQDGYIYIQRIEGGHSSQFIPMVYALYAIVRRKVHCPKDSQILDEEKYELNVIMEVIRKYGVEVKRNDNN